MIPKDLVAAAAVPIILSILNRGDSYGYEIIRTVREASENRLQWSDGMLYPVLHRLEAAGSVESYWKLYNGRRRKYYRITDAGRVRCGETVAQWSDVNRALERLLKGDNDV